MASFPRWLDKARATSAKLITCDAPTAPTGTGGLQQHKRKREAEYADIPPFLLPLSVRVRLDKAQRKTRARVARYDKTTIQLPFPFPQKRNLKPKLRVKVKMPTVLKRLAGPPTCPIVVAQYKDELRGVGHEPDLHWALVVITDRDTLSGPSFQAYAQKRRVRRASRQATSQHPLPLSNKRREADRATDPSERETGTGMGTGPNSATHTNTNTTSAWFGSGTNAIRTELVSTRTEQPEGVPAAAFETQWYTRHAPASLFDVSSTMRSLCLGGVQVGSVRRADVGKLVEYLRSHPPVPAHHAWSSRDYVLELLELLRPFKMLRPDLQTIHLRAREGERREVAVDDLLPDLREVGRITQESIFMEDFRPCVKYAA